jgi:hypothetical protein
MNLQDRFSTAGHISAKYRMAILLNHRNMQDGDLDDDHVIE